MARISQQEIDQIIDEVFSGWPPQSQPVVDDVGRLTDGRGEERARLSSPAAFRRQCLAWRRDVDAQAAWLAQPEPDPDGEEDCADALYQEYLADWQRRQRASR